MLRSALPYAGELVTMEYQLYHKPPPPGHPRTLAGPCDSNVPVLLRSLVRRIRVTGPTISESLARPYPASRWHISESPGPSAPRRPRDESR